MATIAGTIILPDGNSYVGKIKFYRLDAPASIGPLLVTGMHDGLAVSTEEDGQFLTELKAGTYKLQIAGAQAWKIHVLDDAATYNIAELGVPGFPSYGNTGGGTVTVGFVEKAIQGVTKLRSTPQHEDNQIRVLEYLSFLGDGQGGRFIYDFASMLLDDGVDVIKPDDVLESAAGRWHRHLSL